jgi:hypothetical protein
MEVPPRLQKTPIPTNAIKPFANPWYFHHFPQLAFNLNNLRKDPIMQCFKNLCNGN